MTVAGRSEDEWAAALKTARATVLRRWGRDPEGGVVADVDDYVNAAALDCLNHPPPASVDLTAAIIQRAYQAAGAIYRKRKRRATHELPSWTEQSGLPTAPDDSSLLWEEATAGLSRFQRRVASLKAQGYADGEAVTRARARRLKMIRREIAIEQEGKELRMPK